ncbi:MAG TPA: DUF6089 family protein [Flavobacteriales bacterium]|nr:DUF6089 family protein [Flavobacteriales bacterium]
MKKILPLAVILFFVLVYQANAQKKRNRYAFDYGFGLGASNYLGEMGGKEKARRDFVADMKLSQTRWAMNGFARYKFNDYFALNAGLSYLRIEGDDKLSTNRGRKGRNLNFRNDMLEFTARGELYVYSASDIGKNSFQRLDFQSYLFAGLGGVLHAPKTTYKGEWVYLRPLMTEGQAYSKIATTIPIGYGFYFTKKRKYRFGFEMGWRVTFTDYLDDCSTVYVDQSSTGNQMVIDLSNRRPELMVNGSVPNDIYYKPGEKRGDPSHNDTYFTALITYSYVLRSKSTLYRQYEYLWGGRNGRGRIVPQIKF